MAFAQPAPKKKETVPSLTLAQLVSKVIVTPNASSEVLQALDQYKDQLSAKMEQSKKTFRVKAKAKKTKKPAARKK